MTNQCLSFLDIFSIYFAWWKSLRLHYIAYITIFINFIKRLFLDIFCSFLIMVLISIVAIAAYQLYQVHIKFVITLTVILIY